MALSQPLFRRRTLKHWGLERSPAEAFISRVEAVVEPTPEP